MVGMLRDEALVDGLREGWPAAARFELVGRDEERFARGDVHINAGAELAAVGVREGAFGGAVLRHVVLLFGERAAERGVVLAAVTRRGVGLACHLEEGRRDVAVSGRVLDEVVLMILLSGVEVPERPLLHGYGLAQLHGQGGDGAVDGLGVRFVGVVDARAIACALVVALPIEARRVDGLEVELDELVEGDHRRIVGHADRFGEACRLGRHLLIGRRRVRLAIRIAHLGAHHATDLLEEVFRAPEASAGKADGLRSRLVVR